MVNYITISSFILCSLFIVSCHDHDSHDHNDEVVTEYSIDVNEPDNEDKSVGDTLYLDISFNEENGEIVHHVNVQIKNVADSSVVYSKPTEAHVHESSGMYHFSDKIHLDNSFGNADWELEAKVWGHDDGLGLIIEKINFHVNP